MNVNFGNFNRKHMFYSVLLGLFTAVGLTVSLSASVTIDNSPEILMDNEVMVFVRTIAISMSSDRIKTMMFAVGVALLAYAWLQMKKDKKEQVLILLYSGLFAVLQMVAKIFKKYGSYILYTEENVASKTRAGIKLIALWILCDLVMTMVFYIIRRWGLREALPGQKMSWRRIAFGAFLMFLCWLPYFLIFYPGTSNEDTVIQLMEYFKIPSYIQKMSAVQGPDIFFTNHHPYVLAVLFGWFAELGMKMGEIEDGIALYTLLHMCFFATTLSAGVEYIRHIGVSLRRSRGVQLLLMLFPLFPLYSICMVKDTIYSCFSLIFVLMMFEVARTRGEIFRKPWFNVLLFANAIFMMLTKVYGMYILVIVGVFYLVKYRKHFKAIIPSFFITVILYKFVYLSMILPALNVAPGGIQEALSVPFQQTARYVTEYGNEVTEQEKKAINAILPYDKLAKKYEPELSDPVKKKYKQNATKKELMAYFKVWAQMFTKHPEVYVESVLANTYQYYDINKISNLEYYETNKYLEKHDDDKEYTWLYIDNKEEYLEERYAINQLVLALEKTPIVNIFASLGMIPWIILGFVYLNWFRKRGEYNIALLFPLLTIAICLVSPDNGNSRYVMPILIQLPYLVMMLTLKESSDYNEK